MILIEVLKASEVQELSMLRKKLDYTLKGYIFTLLNIALTLNGSPILGIVSGGIALVLFIKALRIKGE